NGDAASVIVRDGVLSNTQLISNECTIENADGNVNDILVYGIVSVVTVDGGSLDKIYIGGPQFRGGSNLKLFVNGGEVATVLIDNEGRGGKGESHVELNGGVLRDLYKGTKSGTLVATNGSLEGNVEMGLASDTVYLNQDADLSNLEVLDGEGGLICQIDSDGSCLENSAMPSFAPAPQHLSANSINNSDDGRVITIGADGQEARFLLNDEDPTDSSGGYRKEDKLYLNTALTGSSVSEGKPGDTRIIHWDTIHIGDARDRKS